MMRWSTFVFIIANLLLTTYDVVAREQPTALLGGESSTPKTIGIKTIRYELYQNNEADVLNSLQALSLKGYVDAQLMLADLLSEKSGFQNASKVVRWYQSAFKEGQGRVRALGSLARFSARFDWLLMENESFVKRALEQYVHTRDTESVVATLETYMAYPLLVSDENFYTLLRLHRKSCIENCNADVYEAYYFSQKGEFAAAETLFLKASLTTSRAISVYFDYLDEFENKPLLFQAFSKKLKPEIKEMTADAQYAVGSRLQGLTEKYDPDVVYWLDAAIANGRLEARINKATYMMSEPEHFSYSETEDVIQKIYETDLLRGKLLRASLLMIREWKKLNPQEAYEILQPLHEEGVKEATIGLGDLYSMGGLDEVDQQKALKHYSLAAQKGTAFAFQKMAAIYRSGRSICNDNVKAYGYSKVASYYGEASASTFMQSLAESMSAEELAEADVFYKQLLSNYPSSEFE